jgi:hypothetical protein
MLFVAAIGCPVGGTEPNSYTSTLLSHMADVDSKTRQSVWRPVEGRVIRRTE